MNQHVLPDTWTRLPRSLRDIVLRKLIDRRKQTGAATTLQLSKADRSRPIPASLEQEFFLSQQRKSGGQLAWTIAAPPIVLDEADPEKVKRALDGLARRHEVLRSVFRAVGDRHELVTVDSQALPFRATKVPLVAAVTGIEPWIRKRYEAMLKEPFDAERGPLWHAELVHRGGRGVILLSFCSAIVDGESLYLINRDILALFDGTAEEPAADAGFDYGDYASMQAELLRSGRYDGTLDWWRNRLRGGPPAAWSDGRRPIAPARLYEQVISSETGRALDAFAASQGTTASVVLLTEFMRLLHEIDGEDDIWVASAAATRDLPGTETMVGTFARQVLLRHSWPADGSALAGVHAMLAETLDQMPVPHLLVRDMLEQDYPGAPSAYRYVFNHRLIGDAASSSEADEDVYFRPGPASVSDAREEDILFMTMQSGERRTLHWYMREDRFDGVEAERLLNKFHTALMHKIARQSIKLNLIFEAEVNPRTPDSLHLTQLVR